MYNILKKRNRGNSPTKDHDFLRREAMKHQYAPRASACSGTLPQFRKLAREL
jgi:hypothetical protein